MGHLRVSAISFLNTAPLLWDLEQGACGTDFDISYTVPSACAMALRDSVADIGIIPAAAYASIPGLVILPDVAIAAKQAVRSILLVSHKPLEQVRSVAMDTSSMTSVALCKVLLEKWLGGRREYLPILPELGAMLARCDAALIIGDPALLVDRTRYFTLDLAEEWQKQTGKPFVFAFWAVRKAALAECAASLDLATVFQRSRDHGLEPQSLDKICREWSARLGMTEAEVRAYLTENIYYWLDAECMEGLQLYFRLAFECGALPSAPALRFLERSRISAD